MIRLGIGTRLVAELELEWTNPENGSGERRKVMNTRSHNLELVSWVWEPD